MSWDLVMMCTPWMRREVGVSEENKKRRNAARQHGDADILGGSVTKRLSTYTDGSPLLGLPESGTEVGVLELAGGGGVAQCLALSF